MTYAQIAGSPEFSALTPEEKKTVAQRFWADDPERAEIATSLVDTNLALPDASPVEKRFLEAKAEDQAFSLIETTPEQAQDYSKFRDERNARLDKTNQLFSDDGARVIGNLIELGQTTNLFGNETLRAKLAGTTDQNNQRYNESRDLVAEQFGVSTDELDDVVRHNLQSQEKAVSRDSFGKVHFKNDLLLKGRDELAKAIESSDLPASVKSSELEGLDQRLSGFETSVVDSVKKNYPEYAQFIGLDGNGDYQKIANSLIQGVGENETTAITNAFRKSGTAIFNALNKLPGAREDRSNLFASVADEVERSRKIDEGQLALSNEFNKEKLRFLGTTGGSIGGGAYSVLESAALAYATGGLVPALGGTGRVVAGANAALRVAPVATTFGVRQGMETYDRAVAAKVDEKEALKLGVVAGLIEGGLTTAFSAVGMGGVESAVAGGAKEVARKTIGNSLKEIGKSVIGEELEENTINALNNALVETKINPNMTVEDFKQSVYDTTIATLLPAGAVGAATNIPTFQQTTPELEQRANAIYSEENLPSLEAPGGVDTQASVDPVVDERAGIEERLKVATGEEREALLERRDEIDAENPVVVEPESIVETGIPVSEIAPENIPDEIAPDAPIETTLPTEDQTETLPTESPAGEPVVTDLNQEVIVPETQINEPQPNPPSTSPVGVEETSGAGETQIETAGTTVENPPLEEANETPVEEPTEQPQLGLRKSLTTQVRKRFGLSDPGIKVSQTDREAIDAADAEIKANPEKGRQLVVSLRDSGRGTNKTEAAILNHELVRLNNELEKAEKAIQDAPDQANTSDAIARADLLRSELDETLDVIERQGSSAGLRLQAQKLILARDYSLEGLQRRALASKNRGAGERQTLTKEENDQIKKDLEYLKGKEDGYREAELDFEIKERKKYEDRAVNNATKEVKLEKQKDSQKTKVARLDQQIKDARKRLKDRQSNEERRYSGAPYTEKDIVDVAIIATAYIRKGVISIQEFTRNLVNEFGDGIEPLAQQIFDESKRVLNASGLLKTPEQIVAENPEPNRQTAYNLLKAYIRNGVVGNSAVDAVAKDLNMTREEASELISGYDRTTNPTRTELQTELSNIRRIASLNKRIADLKAVRTRPKRTPQQVSDEVKALQDELKELAKATKVSIKGDPVQSAKNRLRKQITAIENAIKNNELIETRARSAQTDTELEALKKQADQAKKDYNEAFPEQGTQLTPNEEIDRVVKALDRQIEREDNAIAKDLNKFSWFSPEISERRRTLDAKREARNEIRWRENAEKSARTAIAKAEEIIRTGKFPEATTRRQRTPNQILQVLWDQRNELQTVVSAMRREANADQRQINALEKSIAEYERRIAEKDFSPKPQRQTDNETVLRLRDARKAVAKTYADLRNEATYEDRVVAGIEKRTAAIQERLRTGNLSPEVRPERQDTERIQKARFEYDKAKAEIDQRITDLSVKNLTFGGKALRVTKAGINLLKMIKLAGDIGNLFRNVFPRSAALVGSFQWGKLARMYSAGIRAGLDFTGQQEYEIYQRLADTPEAKEFGGLDKIGLKIINPLDTQAKTQDAGLNIDVIDRLANTKNFTFGLGTLAKFTLALERVNRTFSNIARFESYAVWRALKNGAPMTLKQAKGVAQAANISTGYGGFQQETNFGKSFEKAVPFLNDWITLSARWAASRVQMVTGVPIFVGGPAGSKARIFRDAYLLPLVGRVMMGGMLKAAYLASKGEAPDDPEELLTTFNPWDSNKGGKLDVDGSQLYFDGGQDAFLSLLAKTLTRTEIKDGVETEIKGKDLGRKHLNYWINRANPVISSAVRTFITRETYEGKPMTWDNTAKEWLLPIIASDTKKIFEKHGPEGVVLWLAAFHGGGVRIPEPKKEKPKKVTYSF